MRFEIGLADYYDPAEPGGDDLAGVGVVRQWYNDVQEEEIRRAPEQYWWLHKRWREAPTVKQRRRKKRRAPARAKAA
jgi:KDO2-lipid IV(A) lauroyltransferase